ncbi:MAG: PKD domain-containing protein [Bacteroidetes bacterium]|nr:PKD domain-containing protein [Bacteroidota bacterium]
MLLLSGTGGILFSQVTANFTSNVTSGCSPVAVVFNSTSSTGTITSWFWDLGNGNTSTLQNPSDIYNTPGTYTVTLTVTGVGGSDTRTVVNYITVFQKPDVFIGATPTSGCVPLGVQFANNSIAYPGPFTSLIWDFGDGNTSNSANPFHTYSVPGTYNVLLSTVDNNGCSATNSVPTTINVSTPINANFSFALVGSCGAPVTANFTDISTGTGPFTYSWDFGDGSPLSTAQNPSHTYLANGSYTVTLIIDNGVGCQDTLVVPNAITISALNANFSAAPLQVCVGDPVAFTDLTTGGPLGWDWDFGDGGSSNAQNPSHAYAAPGFYSVELISTRGPGCADTVVQTNLIEVLPIPTANFSAANNTGCSAPLTVNFTDLSVGAVSWLWNFGDGNTSNLPSPPHTYTANGTYSVSLTVTGLNGCTHTVTQNNLVQIIPPVANFNFVGIQAGCMPRTINFTNTSTTTFGVITTYQWDFGDGSNSNNVSPNHTYTTPGTWTVTLIVTTSGGCTDTLVMPALISTGPNPQANFSGSPTTVCFGEPISFTDLSTAATAWGWTFGDGGTSNVQNPTYTYTAVGCYTVTLVVGNNGCIDSRTRNNYVCVEGSEASFTTSATFACDTPATFTFTNTSSGTNLKAYWSFGDGTFDTIPGPVGSVVHVYDSFGVFTVQLISEDTAAVCRDTFFLTVTVSKPTAGFTQNAILGCSPFPVTFADTSIGGITYQWTFGDGGNSAAANPTHNYLVAGNYLAQQIVIGANGCRDTAVSPVPIVVNGAVANFSAVPVATCQNTAITFTDLSTSNSALTAWSWDFGDGSPFVLVQGPLTHSYANPGPYTVRLNVTDANNCTSTFASTITITRPNAAFTQSATMRCPGETINFSASPSTGVGPLTYAWDFGDGVTTTGLNVSHSYATQDTFNVLLVVTDGNGCRDSIVQPMIIARPVAAFAAILSTASCPPLQASYQITNLVNIASWSWDFGDGSPIVNGNAAPFHTYNSPGTFAVTLIVQTITGCADTLLVPNGAVVSGPVGTFSFTPSVTCPGQPVEFIMSPAGAYLNFWTFGDGQAQLSGDTVIYAYSGAGTFTPALLVQDSSGCQLAAPSMGPIQVLPPPIANFGYSDTLLCLADTVRFSDSTVYGGGPATFLWTFGDGGVDSVQNPNHYYSTPGIYPVTLSVTDTLGCSDQDTVLSAVWLMEYYAGFAISDTVVCPNDVITFMDTSYSDTTIVAWFWDFGDTNTAVDSIVTHQYADTGWYNVTLVITTATGCTDTIVVDSAVHVQIPTGSFTISNDTTCPGIPLQFTFNGGNWIVPTWYFGNGDSLVGGDTVSYAYGSPGTYSATVLMTDTLGCTATLPTPFPVDVLPPPIAAFAVDSLLHCDPGNVNLWDLSTYSTGAATINWDFGDGNTGTGAPATHFYATPGYYTVTLAVTDLLGCTDTAIGVDTVRIHQQIANFTSDANTGCLPVLITFTDSSVCDTTIATWNWIFGDGGTGIDSVVGHTYSDTGSYDVTLVITSSVGCVDSVTFPSFINIYSPGLPAIWAATVEGDDQVAVVFHRDSSALFGSYELWRMNPAATNIATEPVQSDTVLYDLASNSLNTANLYRPQIVSICLDSTPLPPTIPHQTVELATLSMVNQVMLMWSPYAGWANVQRYDIFAVQDYDTTNVTFLGSVAGNQAQYVDTTVYCDDLRTYRVRAVGTFPQERSWSDTSAARPIHLPPTYIPAMVTASVLNNQDITVEWSPALFPGAGGFEVFRSTDANTWASQGILPSGTTQFVDLAANVNAQSYYYRITVADSCSYWSQPSDVARSILLELDGSNGVADMSWNAYSNWANGVDRYEMEGRPLNGGAWVLMGTMAANDLTFMDNQGLPGEPGTCYRVTAFESGGNSASSISNEVCFTMDIWVPNTITPNNDGFNDVLIVRALAGYPGTGIDIYNRWGNLVYHNDDYQNDWAGTNGNTGETLPDGTYYWVLHVSDGRTLKGYVTILR